MSEPYDIEISDKLEKKISKLQRKDPQYYEAVVNKILQIKQRDAVFSVAKTPFV